MKKHKSWDERVKSSKEIGKAIQNTYHKGIDPEAAEDMKEALIGFVECYDAGEKPSERLVVDKARAALQKATLNEKE